MSFREEGLRTLRRSIEEAVERSGRRYEDVTVVGASKTQPWEVLWDALDGGVRIFGESYIQEALEKIDAFAEQKMEKSIRWHFIGRLQSRKVKQAVGAFELIHSIDSIKLAETVDHEAQRQGIVQPILLQINVGGESSKGGVGPDQALGVVEAMNGLANVRLEGLMSLPPYEEDPEATRPYHAALRELLERLNDRNAYKNRLTALSMGMTHDFRQAIMEGATHVRVGTLLFGPRATKQG